MAVEIFLMVLHENSTQETTQLIIAIIKKIGGNVELITNKGKTLLVTFDNAFAVSIRGLPYVKLLGGLTIKRRAVIRKQILAE